MISFIETRLFTRLVDEYLTDEEFRELQATLLKNPETGALIPGTGGVRKMRWAPSRRGKRGGLRIIYYLRSADGVVWLLTLYPKNVSESIPAHVLRKIKQEIENE